MIPSKRPRYLCRAHGIMGVYIYRQRIYLCRREKNDKDTARLALQWENVNSRQQWKEIFSSHYTNTWLAGLFRSRCTPLPTCWRVRSIQWSCMAERALWKVCPKRDFRQWGSPSFRLFSDSDLASHKTPLGLEFFLFLLVTLWEGKWAYSSCSDC